MSESLASGQTFRGANKQQKKYGFQPCFTKSRRTQKKVPVKQKIQIWNTDGKDPAGVGGEPGDAPLRPTPLGGGDPEETEAPSGEATSSCPLCPCPHWAAWSWPRLGLCSPLPNLDPSFLSPALSLSTCPSDAARNSRGCQWLVGCPGPGAHRPSLMALLGGERGRSSRTEHGPLLFRPSLGVPSWTLGEGSRKASPARGVARIVNVPA